MNVPNIDIDKKKHPNPSKYKLTLSVYIGLFLLILTIGSHFFINQNIFKDLNPIQNIQKSYFEKNYDETIKLSLKLLNNYPKSIVIRRYLWKSYLYTKKYNLALSTLIEMENLNASNIEVNLGLCTTYRFKRDFNNTMKYCNLVLEKRNSDIANDQILQAYIDADMLDDAINHINQILDTEPDNLKSLILKSNILSLQKKYSESIKILQSAIEKYPEAIPSYYYLGKNFYNLKNYKLAIKNLDIFIESVNHKDIDINLLENAYTTLAVSYEKNNEIEKANKIYLKISCFLFKTNRVREGIELAKKITDKKIDLEKCKI